MMIERRDDLPPFFMKNETNMQFGKKICIDAKKLQAEKYLSKRFT